MVCNHEQVYRDILCLSIDTMIAREERHFIQSLFSSYQGTYAAEYLTVKHPNLAYARHLWLNESTKAVALGMKLNLLIEHNNCEQD